MGLRGRDKQKGALTDQPARRAPDFPKASHHDREDRTARENAQPGAEVKAADQPFPSSDVEPAGLRRRRTGPLSPTSGRRQP